MDAERKSVENIEVIRIKNSPMLINKDQNLSSQGLNNLSLQGLNNYLLILY